MHPIHPIALFRLSVLGPLASREQFEHGEVSRIIRGLATQHYVIPDSNRSLLSAKTIERWYHLWRAGGVDALAPKPRIDKGQSKLPAELQAQIIAAKQTNPRRSIDTIRQYLHDQGITHAGQRLSRSSIHRVLLGAGISTQRQAANVEERRSYEAAYAGDIWYGDVMHGPKLMLDGKSRKVYLVSLMDDASRLITHSAFCLSETALDIEGVLKQAILKRGLPKKLVIDNGAAYRAHSLQGICARLEIRLVYCRPYDPQAKGKLERYHRFFRQHFLSELSPDCINGLADLNARLWAWVEGVHHQRPRPALKGLTPLQRFQQDIEQQRMLGNRAHQLNDLFLHRLKRKVRKDATVAYQGDFYEVPYALAGQSVLLVVDPYALQALRVTSLAGDPLGEVTALDKLKNNHRARHRPNAQADDAELTQAPPLPQHNLVEDILQRQIDRIQPPSDAASKPVSKTTRHDKHRNQENHHV